MVFLKIVPFMWIDEVIPSIRSMSLICFIFSHTMIHDQIKGLKSEGTYDESTVSYRCYSENNPDI